MQFEKESVLSLNDCCDIIKNFDTNCTQIIDYEVQQLISSAFNELVKAAQFSIKIRVLQEGTKMEKTIRFIGKRFQSEYALEVGANEILLYEVLFKEFKRISNSFSDDFAQKCYGRANDLLIVYEDLSERGFAAPESPNALSLNEIKLTLKNLAEFHAGSIVYQEVKTKKLAKKSRLTDDYAECEAEPLFRKDENFLASKWIKERLNVLKALIDLLPQSKDLSAENFKDELDKIAKNSFEVLKPKEEFYNVLCHGDMRPENVMFRYEKRGLPIECKLMNFQLLRYAPPAYDVLLFIYSTTDTEKRKNHLHELLKHYHKCLGKELERNELNVNEILSLEDFKISVRYLLPQIKLQTAYYYSARGVNFDFCNKNALNSDCSSNSETLSVELFSTETNYRVFLTESLTELKDLILHPRFVIEDCFQVIQNKLQTSQYSIINYFVEPLGKISGFFGDHYKLKAEVSVNDHQKVLHFFLKCSSANRTRYNLAVGCGAFMKEAFMLTKLFPLMQNTGIEAINECIIPCHLVHLNDLVVFDDVEFEGFRPMNPREPFGVEELQVVLRKLAIYHACNIILEEKLSQEMKTNFRLGQFQKETQESFFPEKERDNPSSLSIKLALETIPYEIDLFYDKKLSVSKEALKEKYKKACKAIYELIKPSVKFRNVICHGDLWASNFMIKYDNNNGHPIDCRIIDYQILRYCPPAHDLLCLLYLTTTRSIRAKFMMHLIDFYYNEFAKTLDTYGCSVREIYPKEEFLESCEFMTPQAVCQTAIYYHFTMTDSNFMKEYIATDESTNKIFLVDRREFIMDMCQRDSIYKDRLRESIEDLLEMCLKYF